MPDLKQCEIAKVMTSSTISNVQLNTEYNSVSNDDKAKLSTTIDAILKEHSLPLDKGWKIMQNDFSDIASQYNVNSATAFCIYMDWKNENQ